MQEFIRKTFTIILEENDVKTKESPFYLLFRSLFVAMKPFKVALCQITPFHDKMRSVESALSMVCEAASNGASLAVLPEMFYHPFELSEIIKKIGDEDQILDTFCNCARTAGIYICTGSMAVRQGENVFNRSYLIDSQGYVLLSYDKCHLFDVNFRSFRAHESLVFTPGMDVVVAKTELATIGIVICYDIRFPELVRSVALMGAELLLVPAVFNTVTGPAHWNIMMQARAVENQLFLAAVSQGKNPGSSYHSYGHSMIVSPWGDILCEASDEQEILYADIEPEVLEDTRNSLPLLRHRREELYSKLFFPCKPTL